MAQYDNFAINNDNHEYINENFLNKEYTKNSRSLFSSLITTKPLGFVQTNDQEHYENKKKRKLIKDMTIFDSLTEEDSLQVDNQLIINLDSRFNYIKDLLILIIVIFTIIILPLKFVGYFSENIFTLIIESIFDFIFFTDLCSGFFLAYYDSEENYIKVLKKTFENYLKENFIVDLLSAIPINSILEFLFFHNDHLKQKSRISQNTHFFYKISTHNSYNGTWQFSELLIENMGDYTKLIMLLRLLRVFK